MTISIQDTFQKKSRQLSEIFMCDREGIQTPNLLIRSETLYSVELRNHLPLKRRANVQKTFLFLSDILKKIVVGFLKSDKISLILDLHYCNLPLAIFCEVANT